MTQGVTHYEVLGVPPTADPATVRRAYLRLARQNHPDFHNGDEVARRRAERSMQRVNEAWSVLGDESSRAAYDRTLPDGVRPPRQPRPGFGPKHGPSWHPSGADPEVVDPDLLDDTPLSDAHVRGSWTLLPVTLFASAVVLFCVGLVLQAAPLLALSVMCFVLALLGFLVLPFLAMASSRQDDLAGGGRA